MKTFLITVLVSFTSLAAEWHAGTLLLPPGPPGTFDETAVKDPSIVRYGGRWHLFYTARGRGSYSLGYLTEASLNAMAGATRHQIEQLSGKTDPYAAAPQVFYFRPHRRWYLIFQTKDANYQPVFSTNADISRTDLWTPPRKLIEKRDTAKWIDFWVICDDSFAYLYFTRNHTDLFCAKTPLASYPSGWQEPVRVYGPLHESAHVYRTQRGSARYWLLFEKAARDIRSYGLAIAPNPSGPWRDADQGFATGDSIRFEPGVEAWTAEVSHGELIRSGFDERMEIDSDRLEFVIQGLPRGAHNGDYPSLPWRLGLIRALRDKP